MEKVNIGLWNDPGVLAEAIRNFLPQKETRYTILFDVDTAACIQRKLSDKFLPDVLLIYSQTIENSLLGSVQWVARNYPQIKLFLVGSAAKDEIVSMFRLGVRGYYSAKVSPQKLHRTIQLVVHHGFYYPSAAMEVLREFILANDPDSAETAAQMKQVNNREKDFIRLACTEFTYNEIAAKMYLSPKTIDGYRNALFEKLNVKSRVGLAMFAVRHGLVELKSAQE